MQDLISKIVSEMIPPGRDAAHVCSHTASGTCSVCGQCALFRPKETNQIVAAGASRLSFSPGDGAALKAKIARLIDHTILKPETTEADVRRLCEEALRYGFASVCVNTCWVPLCRRLVQGGRVKVCTVVSFPLGSNATEVKAYEAAQAVKAGADELDMVANLGWIKEGKLDLVQHDIRAVVKAAKGAAVKVIIETCLLTDEEKVRACLAAKAAGAAFVKTSTGFNKEGATVGDVALMRRVVGREMGVKASGGIRDLETATQMVEYGATRIGASASVGIVG